HQALAEEIDEACREIGFLVIEGHGIDPALVEEMHRVFGEYFALPHWEKMRFKMPDDRYRGYVPPASEGLAGSLDEVAPLDLKEPFSTGPFDHPLDEYHFGPDGSRFFAPNVWPDRPVGMREVFEAYYAAMEDLAADLMRLFALALGVDERFFDDKIDQQIANFSAIFYGSQADLDPLPGQLRAGAHSDYGSLTIVHTDSDVGGLEVKDKSGAWVGVPCIPGTFVVNLGDLMADWTNDRWVSTLHRVVNPPDEAPDAEKTSLIFFHQPNYDAVIECIPTCTNPDEPPKHEPITSGEHVTRKIMKQRQID
ncbi:MAG: isopenicillin N synthase family dioxygenase, partial [Ilumatobacter sp.]